MSRGVVRRSRIVNGMRCRCAISRRDALRTSHMHRRFAGYFGSETKTAATVMALVVRHRAHRVTLGMIAGPAARAPGHSGSGNNDDAHGFILAFSYAATRTTTTPAPTLTLGHLTICSKSDTYS